MESIADLFGRMHLVKNGKPLGERQTLIGYFADELSRPPSFIGQRLAHYSLSDLYALQSGYKDRLNRNGSEAARKYWWWISRTEINSDP